MVYDSVKADITVAHTVTITGVIILTNVPRYT